MPRPAEPGRPYVAGLDGVRAVAVLLVIAYHLGLPAARGGMLGVGVFFTLSGYLITDLLLGHWGQHGHLGLGEFWLRRARRLLPGLFLIPAVVGVGTGPPAGVRPSPGAPPAGVWGGAAPRGGRAARRCARRSTPQALRVCSASSFSSGGRAPFLPSSIPTGSSCCRSRRWRCSPRWSTRRAGWAGRWGGVRCAGSASAPTASTSGSGPSSSSRARGQVRSAG